MSFSSNNYKKPKESKTAWKVIGWDIIDDRIVVVPLVSRNSYSLVLLSRTQPANTLTLKSGILSIVKSLAELDDAWLEYIFPSRREVGTHVYSD